MNKTICREFRLLRLCILPMLMLFLTGGGAHSQSRLRWVTYSETGAPLDAKEVIAAANACSEEKIGVTVNLEFQPTEKINLMMASGEYYDIVFTCSWVNDFDKNAEAGLYYDITDLVQKETPALYQSIGKYWDCAKINGRIMGIPILKNMGAQNMFRLNADYLEGQKGMEIPEEMDGLEALEPFLKAYKEDYPDKYPIAMDRGGPPGYMNFVEQIAGGIIVIPYDQETEIPQAIFGDYSTELRTGTSDPDVVIPKMRARMEAAGFDELLADVQDQINEWFASDNLSQPDSDSDPPHSTYPSSS